MDADQPAESGSVRFAPRLTEDSLPVTLPKDADRAPEATVSGDQPVTQPSSEDRRVSAGVLDLQLVPQVAGTSVFMDAIDSKSTWVRCLWNTTLE